MRRFRDMPIGQKILVVTTVASGAALLITGLTARVYDLTSFRPGVLRDLNAEVDILRPSVTASLRFFDSQSAREDLESLRASREIRVAAVYESDGTLFASWAEPPAVLTDFPEMLDGEVHRFDGGVLHLWSPISHEEELIGFLYVQRDLPPLYARMGEYGLIFVGVLVALISASVVLLLSLRRTISAPILALSRAAEAVRDGQDFDVRAKPLGDDEIGRLAGGVAHDFNNFLTVMAGSIELLMAELPPESDLRDVIRNVRKAIGQASDLTRQLLAFARKQLIEPKLVDPNALAAEVQPTLRSLIKEDIELVVNPAPEPWSVRVDPDQLTQVLMNLATNARDAMPNGGRLTIEIRNAMMLDEVPPEIPGPLTGEFVLIAVSDTGEGMTDETRRRLFEPFFTTKERGKGTGLGLATTYGIVKQSGGYIRVDSEPGRGTVFHVYLRRAYGKGESPPAILEHAVPPGDETLLVVEDNALLRATTVKVLRSGGYDVLEARDGAEALQLVEDYTGTIDLLVTDMVMPRMSGRDVATRLKDSRPDLKVLFVSGYAVDDLNPGDLESGGIELLEKPFTTKSLVNRVRALLDR